MGSSLHPALSSLLNKISLDDHEEVLAASEQVLKNSNTNTQAQHIKAVALVKLDKYEEATGFMESCGPDLTESAKLVYAYALYKSGRLEDAARIAAAIDEDDRGAQHVEAQARYRLGDYENTANIYRTIRRQQVSDEDFELRINQGAIDILGQWSGVSHSVQKPSRDDLDAYETAYNAACGSIAKGELSQAEILLKRAKELCKHSDDVAESARLEDLLLITAQQIFVLLRQGKLDEAESFLQDFDIEKIAFASARKIATINSLITSKQSSNPFLVYKIFNDAPTIPDSDKLLPYQSILMISNQKTIELQSSKLNGLAKPASKHLWKENLLSLDPQNLLQSSFGAAARTKNETGRAAIRNVLPELKRHQDDVGLIITLVQMYVLAGNTTTAIEVVESFFERLDGSDEEPKQAVRYHPGLVSILVSLYRLQGRAAHVKRELAQAATYWRHKSNPPVALLRAAGVSLLHSSSTTDSRNASEIFAKLYEQQPDDKATIAGYIASHALEDAQSIQSLVGKLTPVPKLISGIDVESLEVIGIPQSANALAIATSAGRLSRKRMAADQGTNLRKRVRKSRLPKDFDPNSNSKPDPERWLPLRDRSYYRAPKSKKKGRKGDDRTQGGNVNEDLDVSKQGHSKAGETGSGGGKKKKGKSKK